MTDPVFLLAELKTHIRRSDELLEDWKFAMAKWVAEGKLSINDVRRDALKLPPLKEKA